MDMYVESGVKKLRCGYTTGSSAAAAAKAATYILFNKRMIDYIEIDTPKELKLKIKVNSVVIGENYVKVSVLKDGGDDIDATDGIEVFAIVEKSNSSFQLIGGQGIGIVTKDGLAIKKGEYAINPVPRKMIKEEVLKVLPKDVGVRVTISIPEGIKIAEKTFNPRLGIKGGISVLGTTGIVYPMSEDSLKESIKIEIKQKAENKKKLVLTFGSMGEEVAKKEGYSEDEIVIISNFLGFALDTCVMAKVKEIILVGHIGKMSKVAYGCFNTHSRVNDVRLEVLALELVLLGYDIELVKSVLEQKTTEGAVNLLGEGYETLYRVIGEKIINRVEQYTYGDIVCKVVMYYGFTSSSILYKGVDL